MALLTAITNMRMPFRFLFAFELWWIVLSLMEQHTGFRL